MHASFVKTITEADIVLFAAVSGDNNALHINQEFAQTTQFKGRIAHGMLSASVISAAIAGRLSGPGTNMGQNLHFKAPIRAGDTVHATVTVKELIPEKCRARLTTVCTVDGEIVIDGGCIGNDHVARSPKNLSLRADRAKERLLDPRPEISLRSGGCDRNGGLTPQTSASRFIRIPRCLKRSAWPRKRWKERLPICTFRRRNRHGEDA